MLGTIKTKYLEWLFNAGQDCPECHATGQQWHGDQLVECDACHGLGVQPPQ